MTVYANPGGSAAPGTITGSPPTAPGLPGLVMPAVTTPCNVFPFGLPCWLVNQIGQFASGTSSPPAFSISTPSLLGGGNLTVDLNHPFGADLSGIMAIVRPVLLLLATIGIFVWLAGMAMGGSTGSGRTANESEE